MNRLAALFVFFILALFPFSIFAQSQEQGNVALQEQSEEAVSKVKAEARKALDENTRLSKDNEALKRKQIDLEKQIPFLQGEIERAKEDIARYKKWIGDIAKKKRKAEKHFDDFTRTLKVLASERQGLEKKIAYAQAQNLKEQEDKLSEASIAAETKRQQMILKAENDLQYKINDLDAENKILHSQIVDLSEKIAKAQKEKDFLESLLKQHKQGDLQVKAVKDVLPTSSSEAFIPAKSLWKVPDILKE